MREVFDMAKAKIVIGSQYRENYGAHDWDGKGECPQYWKFKGGSTYVIEFDVNSESAKDIVEAVKPLIEYSNTASEEYILDYSVVDLDETPWEEWETPYFITKNFYGNFIAERPIKDWFDHEVVGSESYVMLPEGDRAEYHRQMREVA